METFELQACGDCIALLANGDVGDRGEMPRNVAADRAYCADAGLPIGLEADGDHLYDLPGDDQDENPTTRHADKVAEQWPPDDGWHLELGSCEDHGGCVEFTWSACEVCGSRLGGSRHAATAWRVS